ncbi:hypothetical protein CYY_000477 [Polysphondylium violaceum]|uniref:Phospholipase B-like n=1 Tax=Polysphondylium violaceum TaxID=133409 RepID=A0A8J4Q3P3_9MYCE|nr:hypothetical protein CYY_000477 [Polysphondylium violaceum]
MIKRSILSLLLFFVIAVVCQTNLSTYSVRISNTGTGGFQVYAGNDSNAVAQASYANEMMTTGWGYISITTNPSFDDTTMAQAAGYIEGYLSQELIWATWSNTYVNEYNSAAVPDNILNFATENMVYIQQQIKANPTDPYWTHIYLVWSQMSSMVDGYNDATTDSSQQLSLMEFMLMNMDADLGDIIPSLNLTVSDFRKERAIMKGHFKKTDHCSGLIKFTDDLQELYTAHTSWSPYYVMVRMFKSYNFKYSTSSKAHVMMFSGYPATLASCDDFYLLDSRLVVTETTNGFINNELYSLITPNSVLSWMRSIVSNRIAKDGLTWCQTFSRENSGTYCNQWMITDYNKFQPGVKLHDGTLYILEQIPGYIEYADVTGVLRTGYWPSFNVPYFENVFNMSGFNDTSSSDYEPWESDPRSQIFRRDANKVQTLQDFQAIMRYNDYQNDPLSQGDAANQISSRYDLNLPTASDYDAFGGIDSKVTSLALLNQLTVLAQSGPTHDQQPPFEWSNGNWSAMYPTIGMPNTWDFGWVQFTDTTFTIPQSSNKNK